MKSRSNKQTKHSNRIYWAIASIPMVIATCGLILFVTIDKQPSHYEGDKFTNETTVMSNTDNSSDESSSPVTEQYTDSSTNNVSCDTEYSEPEQVISGSRAYQPTFEVEQVSSKNDLYTVKHLPTGDTTKALTYEDANAFCTYMEQIAYGKTQLEYSMDQNFNYWKENVKGN